jgi:hypothetical protein
MRRLATCGCCLAMFAAMLLGCNKKYDIVPLKGTLTYDGQPVPDMIVRFEPSVGRPSDSFTDANGSFDMSYTIDRMGVEVDTHKVTVFWPPTDDKANAKPPPLQQKVLADFKTHGPLEVTIEKPQSNFEIKLPR